MDLTGKLAALNSSLIDLGSVVVAFSGGVDSTFVLAAAVRALGDQALAVTGVSPSVPQAELAEAHELARGLGARHELMETHEFDDPGYVENSPRRCYHCKHELYGLLADLARQRDLAAVVDGCNLDDLGDFRPGRQAAADHGVRSPLVEAGFTKADVREASRLWGLPTWDKPAMACLASRIPHGTPVTVEALGSVEAAEAFVRGLGVRQLRVRHHGETARLETDDAGFEVLARPEVRQRAVDFLKRLGYRYVTLDLAGYRPAGSEVLQRVPERLATND